MLREEISTFTLPDSGSDQEFIDALPISGAFGSCPFGVPFAAD
jgi:hypothetical protein